MEGQQALREAEERIQAGDETFVLHILNTPLHNCNSWFKGECLRERELLVINVWLWQAGNADGVFKQSA